MLMQFGEDHLINFILNFICGSHSNKEEVGARFSMLFNFYHDPLTLSSTIKEIE